jgi:DNA-binding MarR family transcriptional regulator
MHPKSSKKDPHPRNPGRQIARAGRLLMRWGDIQLKPLGFTTGQLPVLVALGDGSARSQKELTEWAGIEQPSMAQMLARMERDGLVTRQKDPEDSRSTLFSLSKTALKRIPKARELLSQGNDVSLQGFTKAETAALHDMMTRVITNLSTALELPVPPERER